MGDLTSALLARWKFNEGAYQVRAIAGTGEFLRARYKGAVTTAPIEFVFPKISDGIISSELLIYSEAVTPISSDTLMLAVTIDAVDAAEAATRLTIADSLAVDVLWIPVPVGVLTIIPIEGGLVNGLVHVKATGATTVNVWAAVQ